MRGEVLSRWSAFPIVHTEKWQEAIGPGQQRGHTASKLAVSALSLALGGLLPFLSVHRVVAEFLTLPGNRVLTMLQKGATPSERDLAILVTSRERSLAWGDSGRSLPRDNQTRELATISHTSHGGTCVASVSACQARSRRRRWPLRPGFTGAS